MDPTAEVAFKQNCYMFYDRINNRYKTVDDIKQKSRCQLTKNKRKMLYLKRDGSEEYDFISKKKLADYGCVNNYNQYINPDKSRPLDLDNDLLINCSSNSFRDINADYDDLLKYAYAISDELHVDELIKEFIINLVIYTNINKEGLEELFKGAFVIIRDKGFIYNKFKCPDKARICDVKKFIAESSHDSLHKDNQYRIGNGIIYACDEDGKCNKTKSNNVFDLLVGTSPLEYFYGDTWIQFEYANLLTPWNKWALHAYSTARYFMFKKNVGPLGDSEYAEYTKPLILDICNIENCSQPICEPIPCVRPNINLFEYSENFIRQFNISFESYKNIKNFIKSELNKNGEFTLSDIKKKFENYEERYLSEYIEESQGTTDENFILTKNLLPYINEIVGPRKKYDREEIIEIMFLINYYIEQGLSPNENIINDIKSKLAERYPLSTGGRKKSRKSIKKYGKNKNRRTRKEK